MTGFGKRITVRLKWMSLNTVAGSVVVPRDKFEVAQRIKRRQRLAAVGFFVGLGIMLGTFTRFSYLAGLGFILMVASAATIVIAVRASRVDQAASFSVAGWMDDVRERWRRER